MKKIKDQEAREERNKSLQEQFRESVRVQKIQQHIDMTASIPAKAGQLPPPTEQKLQEPAPQSSMGVVHQPQAQATTPEGQPITNKNVLNRKTLEALNQTQQMFPSFQLQNPGRMSLN